MTRWDVPMRAPYRSAKRVTTVAHNVLVTVRLDSETVGYGESAPATYVTGETQESVLEAAQSVANELIGLSPDAALSDGLCTACTGAPGARGALEMASDRRTGPR